MSRKESQVSFEICILAGGLSRRMGRDKSRVRLAGRAMLGRVRANAEKTGWPTRVIREDLVPGCGPLGGIYTALATTKAEAVLFLACDMPFVSGELIALMIEKFHSARAAVFVSFAHQVGFPFILARDVLPLLSRQLARKEFAIWSLARKLEAKIFRPSAQLAAQLRNVNTPEDLASASVAIGKGC